MLDGSCRTKLPALLFIIIHMIYYYNNAAENCRRVCWHVLLTPTARPDPAAAAAHA